MNIIQRPSSDGKKNYYAVYYGTDKGERRALGKKIFSWIKPVDEFQKKHNQEVLKILKLKESELTIEGASGADYLPNHKLRYE